MGTGGLIRAARKAKNLTQKQLGELSGIAEPTIRRYELGKLNPKYETLQSIATALEIPVWQLIPATDQEPDRDYELVCDTLDMADLRMEAAGLGDGTGPDGDLYFVWHKDSENPTEDRVQYAFRDLFRIATEVQKAAELKKYDYIRKRIEAELF